MKALYTEQASEIEGTDEFLITPVLHQFKAQMDATKQEKQYKIMLIAIPDQTTKVIERDVGVEFERLSGEFVAVGRELAKMPCTVGFVFAKSVNPYKNFAFMYDNLKNAGLTNFALVNQYDKDLSIGFHNMNQFAQRVEKNFYDYMESNNIRPDF